MIFYYLEASKRLSFDDLIRRWQAPMFFSLVASGGSWSLPWVLPFSRTIPEWVCTVDSGYTGPENMVSLVRYNERSGMSRVGA
jgi:hypothetical protein